MEPLARTTPIPDPLAPYLEVDRSSSRHECWGAGHMVAGIDQDARTIVITCAKADRDRLAAAEQVATVVLAGENRVEPAAALQALAGLGFGVVLCEDGTRWLGELVAAGRLEELCLSISPLIGGAPLPVSVAPPQPALRDSNCRALWSRTTRSSCATRCPPPRARTMSEVARP